MRHYRRSADTAVVSRSIKEGEAMYNRLSGIRSRRASLGAIAALALSASAIGMAPAQSSTSSPDNPCPTPYPVSQLKPNDVVHGLTVDAADGPSTTPDPFTGTVMGVLQDGIAPGMDMIMVKLSSPVID